MLTILKSIELSTDYLVNKGVDSARINAELLLAHILKCKRMDLYLKFDQPLSEQEIVEYRELIKRRGLREPLQYITGTTEFYGSEFKVSPAVLIPRQETELLVEEVIKYSKDKNELKILDIGTGSGNIAITLVQNIQNATLHSIDISPKAIEIAKSNAESLGVNGRLLLSNISIEKFTVTNDQKYDIIVSNPPYVSIEEFANLEPELVNFEPKEALTDDNDGLKFYNIIISKANQLLNNGGRLFFELGAGQSSAVKKIMEKEGLRNINIINDYQNIARIISGDLQ
jgi:release factor glutamine methyltransferase